ncbi:hypothetical protein ARSEF1564_009373, partial [Beauveria bassiana]
MKAETRESFTHYKKTENDGRSQALYFDGRPSIIGIAAVNEILRTVGVRAGQVPVPTEAYPILEASKTRAISEDEQAKLISLFSLSRKDLLAQIQLAGRTPEGEKIAAVLTREGLEMTKVIPGHCS